MKRPVTLLAASLLFLSPLLLLPYVGGAQEERWQLLGLRGETVLAISVAVGNDGKRVVYAETLTGLKRYSEGSSAKEWQRIDASLPRTALGNSALAAWRLVLGRAQQLYALTGSGTARQLYHSDDGGDSWHLVGPAPGQIDRPPMAASPGMAGAPDMITLVTDSRVQRSTDGGTTWAPGGPWPDEGAGTGGGHLPWVRLLLSDNSAPHRLYALTDTGALWISESNGLAWRGTQPKDGSGVPLPIAALAIAPYFGVHIWAATADGIHHSTDNGDNWSVRPLPATLRRRAQIGQGSSIVALLVDPRVPDTIYAALNRGDVFRSDDRGERWEALGKPGETRIYGLALDPDTRGQLYAATTNGVWTRQVAPPEPAALPAPTQTALEEPSLTPTSLPTDTPRATETATHTPAATSTAAPSLTSSPSETPTASATATRMPTRTRVRTPTPILPTMSPTAVPTTVEPVSRPIGPQPTPVERIPTLIPTPPPR